MTTQADLEAAITRDPEDPAPYLVYADYLQSNGDPTGELIVLQARGQTAPAQALIEEHRMLGELADFTTTGPRAGRRVLSLDWYHGFLRTAHIGWETFGGDRDQAAADLVTLLDLPAARFLRNLTVGPVPADDIMSFDFLVAALVEHGKPVTLRNLTVGDTGHWDISGVEAGPFTAVVAAFPELDTLTVHAGMIALGTLVHPKLRALAVQSGGLSNSVIADIARSELPALERLEVWLGTPNYGGISDVADVLPLLDASKFPRVVDLQLMNAVITDEIVEALATSTILPQLRSLDLSMGTLSDAGVRTMAAARERFAHLQHLNLDDNALTEASRPLVEGLAREVEFGETHEPDRAEGDVDNRYSSVGE